MSGPTDRLLTNVPWDFVTETLPPRVMPTTALPPRTEFRNEEQG